MCLALVKGARVQLLGDRVLSIARSSAPKRDLGRQRKLKPIHRHLAAGVELA